MTAAAPPEPVPVLCWGWGAGGWRRAHRSSHLSPAVNHQTPPASFQPGGASQEAPATPKPPVCPSTQRETALAEWEARAFSRGKVAPGHWPPAGKPPKLSFPTPPAADSRRAAGPLPLYLSISRDAFPAPEQQQAHQGLPPAAARPAGRLGCCFGCCRRPDFGRLFSSPGAAAPASPLLSRRGLHRL